MQVRRVHAVLSLLVLLSVSASAYPAVLDVHEATLYVAAPAELIAFLVPETETVTLDMPGGLLADTLRVSQGERTIFAVAQPILKPQQGLLPPEIDRYQVQLSGLEEQVPVSLRFRTRGLSWTPATTLHLDGRNGALETQASITNEALDLSGAKLRLMSGLVAERGSRAILMDDPFDVGFYFEMMRQLGRESTAEVGGIHLAAELEGVDVPKGSTRQAPLLSGQVAVTRSYRWDTSSAGEPGLGMPARAERATAIYSFANSLPRPLPEGSVTVTESGTLVGTGYAAWTPPGETVLVAVASVQGLTVRRSQETAARPETWEMLHTVRLQVGSTRDEPLTIRVAEHLRDAWYYDDTWDDRPAYEFTLQPEVGTEDVLIWDLPIPVRGRAEVSYSYAEPIDLASLRVLSITPDGSPQERRYIFESDRAAVQMVMDGSQQRIRRIQPDGHITYRLPIPANVAQADLIVSGANTLRVSLAPEVNGNPGPFEVVADLVAISGRRVDDASNYSNLTFDLTPVLGENQVAYVMLDNSSGGEAFFAWVEAYRVPEGFPSRGQQYAVGDAPSPVVPAPVAATPAPRRILYSFTPGTAAEDAQIYLDRRTSLVSQFSARVGYIGAKMVYSFTIPPDVEEADLIIDTWGITVVAVARDEEGVPGEFQEELNLLDLVGRVDYGEGWSRQDYAVDLTPYLEGNSSRTVYVAVYAADQTTGWGGTAWSQIEVAALDDGERVRFARIQRTVDYMANEQRARCLLHVRTNRGEGDAAYVYEDRGSEMQRPSRVVEGDAQVTYRFPMKPEYHGARFLVWVLGDALVSYATDDDGGPGEFTDVYGTRDQFEQHAIETHTNPGHAEIAITSMVLDSGALYIRVRDDAPDLPGHAQIHALAVMRP